MDLLPAHIRDLMPEDIAIVSEIAKAAMDYPWSLAVFRDCMKADYHGWVLSDDAVATDKILGFAMVLNQVGESQLLNVCVLPDYQRRGYGRQLIEHVMEYARASGLDCIRLEVRASNRAAISVYHALGFIDVGLRKEYYPARSGREDALIMAFRA